MIKNDFKVIRAGINSTFQDKGRANLYHIGIPFSGVMDNRNYLIANSLLNNDLELPTLEFAYQGPLLKYNGENINIAITGDAIFNLKIDGILYEGQPYVTYQIKDGDEIDILSTNKSVYGYLAISGKFNLRYHWESYSTNTRANIGSNNGEKLSDGQIIEIIKINSLEIKRKLKYQNNKIEKIRVIKGTNYDYFSNEGINNFFSKVFTVSKLSDRMGMRLEGPKIENIVDTNIKSEGLVKGVIQIPADGNPIIMLSDHGTIGGYPKIGVVISADYDKLVQLNSSSNIKFQEVELSDAETLFSLYQMETKNILSQIK